MKLKRYLAALLAGAMVLTSVPVTGLTVQAEEQEIETGDGELDLDAEEMEKEYVYTYQAVDREVLEKNAFANSQQTDQNGNPSWTNDGRASWAFNGNTGNWWHSRYEHWDVAIANGEDITSEEQKQTVFTENGPTVYIGSAFEKEIELAKVVYQGRSGTNNNAIGNFKLWVADMDDPSATPGENDWKVAASSIDVEGAEKVAAFKNNSEQAFELKTPVKATHFKLEALGVSAVSQGDVHCVTASKIEVYERTGIAGVYSKAKIKMGAADSQELTGESSGADGWARYAVDGDDSTYWHSDYNRVEASEQKIENYPNYYIALEEASDVDRIAYLPRQNTSSDVNGTILKCEVYITRDALEGMPSLAEITDETTAETKNTAAKELFEAANWSESPVETATFDAGNWENDQLKKEIRFASTQKDVTGIKIKVTATGSAGADGTNNDKFISGAEFSVLKDEEIEEPPVELTSVRIENPANGDLNLTEEQLALLNKLDNLVISVVYKLNATVESVTRVPLVTLTGADDNFFTLWNDQKSGGVGYEASVQKKEIMFSTIGAGANNLEWHKLTAAITADRMYTVFDGEHKLNVNGVGWPYPAANNDGNKWAEAKNALLGHTWEITAGQAGQKAANGTYKQNLVDAFPGIIQYIEISGTANNAETVLAENTAVATKLAEEKAKLLSDGLDAESYTEESWERYAAEKEKLDTAATEWDIYNAIDKYAVEKEALEKRPVVEVTEITSVDVTLAAPVKDAQAADAAVADDANYTVESTAWNPALTDNTFAANTAYTATVTLKAKEHCAFAEETQATVAGAESVTTEVQENGDLAVTCVFAKTEALEATNIALRKQVVAFDGNEVEGEDKSLPEKLVDEKGDNTNNDWERWASGVRLKQSGANGAPLEGKAYFVLDLGENTETDLEKMVIRWHNLAWATNYVMETSDVCTVDENRRMDLTSDADEWTTVKTFTKENGNDAYPRDEITFDAGTKLKRYVRFVFTSINTQAGGQVVSLREIELWGVQTVKETPKPVDPLAAEKEALQAAITAAQAVADAGQGDYTDASWTEFTAKLDAAKAALAAEDATADSLTAAKTALTEAQEALTEEQPVIPEYRNLTIKMGAADSQELTGENEGNGWAIHAVDGNAQTHWHSNWQTIADDARIDNYPNYYIALEKAGSVDKVTYLPRQTSGTNGTIKKLKVYVTTDALDGMPTIAEVTSAEAANAKNAEALALFTAEGVKWTEVESTAFENGEWPENKDLKEYVFKEIQKNVTGIKIEVVSTQGDTPNKFISAGEFGVVTSEPEAPVKTALKAPKLTVSGVNADVTGDNQGDPALVGDYTQTEGGQEVAFAESDGVYGFNGDFTVGDALDAAGSEPMMIKFKLKIDQEPTGNLTIFEKGTGEHTQFNLKSRTFEGRKVLGWEAGFYTNNPGGRKYPAAAILHSTLGADFWGAWHEVVLMYKGAGSTAEIYIDDKVTSTRNEMGGLQVDAPIPSLYEVETPATFTHNDGVYLADFELYKGSSVPTSAHNLAEVNAQLAADAVPAYSLGVKRDLKDYTIATAWSKTEDDADKVTATLTVLDPEKTMFDETSKPTSIIVGKEYVTDIEVEVAEDGQTMTVSYAYPPLIRKIRSIELTVDAPVTGRAPAQEATTEDAGYTAGNLAWSLGEEAFTGEAFAASTAYSASVELTAKEGYEFLANVDDIVVKVNGEDASIEATETGVKVSYTFAATASEEDQIAQDKEDFEKALAAAKEVKNDDQYYTEDSWVAYQEALADVEKMPLTSLAEIQAAEAALEAAKKLLVRNVVEITDTPDVTVVAPVVGAAPADAVLSKKNDLITSAKFTTENMEIDEEGGISGKLTAPNSEPENAVFDIKDKTKLLLHFSMKSDKPSANGTQAIVGKMNSQYGVQLKRENDTVRLLFYAQYKDGQWPEQSYTIPSDEWWGKWHDVVAYFDGSKLHLYVDGQRPTTGRDFEGELKSDSDSVFTVGYNVAPSPASDDPKGNKELYEGKLRNFAVYAGDQVPDYEITAEDTADQISAKLEAGLEGKEAALTLSGQTLAQDGKYSVEKTEWKPLDDAFVRYQDYEVKVTLKADEGYIFKEDATAALRVGADSVLGNEENPVTVAVIDNGDRMTITYTFQGEEHPRVTLQKYLASDDVANCYVVVGNELKNQISEEDATRKWTIASWNAFVEAYRAAYDAAEDGTLEPSEYEDARKALEDVIAGMDLAAETCECVVSGITGFTNVTREIEMGKNLEIDLPTSLRCTESAAGSCLVSGHETTGVTFTFAVGTTNTAGASIKDGKLVVTKAGSVEVIATAHKGEATTDETATYTIKDKKATPDEKKQLTEEINKITEAYEPNADKYTQESWNALAEAIAEAKKLGASATSVQVAEAQKKIADAKAALVIKDKKALDDLIEEIKKLNKDDYTAETWNPMVDVYNRVIKLPANASLDDYSKAFNELTAVYSALVTKADELAAAKAEVQKALTAADAVYKAGQQKYTDATWKVFADAYTAAKNAPANADAAMLKKLAAALSTAQNGLKAGLPYGTIDNSYQETVKGVRYAVVNAKKKTAKVVGGKSKSMKSLFVPATVKLNGVKCKVVQVAPKAFKGYTKLKKVKLGKNVTTIGKQSFMGCKKLTNIIVISKSLKSIKSGAFKKTAAKKVVVQLPKKLKASQRKKLQKQFTKAGLSKKAKFK